MLIGSLLFFQIFCASGFINPRSVEKGMQGIALSTFEENRIDTIEVKILGTMPDFQFERDMIVAKLKGKVVDEAGVIAGMSGSPVYIDGKLLGAISHGYSFSKEPICVITPFTDMKKMDERKSVGSSRKRGGEVLPIRTLAPLTSHSGEIRPSSPRFMYASSLLTPRQSGSGTSK